MSETGANYTLKEEIRAYWSMRAETFDKSVGHSIQSPREMEAFRVLLRDSFGAEPLEVLDLACGTGEITRALLTLGHRVTGLDFAEPMLSLARERHGSRARILAGDAERLLDPDGAYDALVTRHLVWTLTDPETAFAEWFRVLRPGGKLLVLDGDFINRSLLQKLAHALAERAQLLGGRAPPHRLERETFDSIASRFYFRDGLTAGKLEAMLRAAGFGAVTAANYRPILRAQEAMLPWPEALKRRVSTRFALLTTK